MITTARTSLATAAMAVGLSLLVVPSVATAVTPVSEADPSVSTAAPVDPPAQQAEPAEKRSEQAPDQPTTSPREASTDAVVRECRDIVDDARSEKCFQDAVDEGTIKAIPEQDQRRFAVPAAVEEDEPSQDDTTPPIDVPGLPGTSPTDITSPTPPTSPPVVIDPPDDSDPTPTPTATASAPPVSVPTSAPAAPRPSLPAVPVRPRAQGDTQSGTRPEGSTLQSQQQAVPENSECTDAAVCQTRSEVAATSSVDGLPDTGAPGLGVPLSALGVALMVGGAALLRGGRRTPGRHVLR